MKKSFPFILSFLFLILNIFPLSLNGVNIHDTRMLNQPAMSENQVAFVYAEDLWITDINGNKAQRLTSDEGVESHPVFSPDGKWVAFSAQYDGNTDVYIVPAEGGVPQRLTWHPQRDIVRGFTPDGESVLFISSRFSFTRRHSQLFTVSMEGGFPQKLKLPRAYKAAYSPDGSQLAYTPLYEAFHQWKYYRGGTVSKIKIFRFEDYSVRMIPQPEGRCNDTDPMWIGDKIYFRSDRNGEFNLFCYDLNSQKIQQLTFFTDFPVLNAGAGEEAIVFEKGGYLHIYDIPQKKSRRLTIGAAADLQEVRSRYVKGSRYIRDSSISPSGARGVFEFRGEIVTVPAEKGDPRNLTSSPGVHECSPSWSPDGKHMAYFSDESREYQLHIKDLEEGEVKKIEVNGAGFYEDPVWSPDSQKLTFTDNSWSLYWVDIASEEVTKIASEYLYGPSGMKTLRGVWSPDSRWIAYTLNTQAYIQRVYVYSLEKDKSYAVTDGMSDVSDPVFDKSGKYLYFFSSTDAGPVKHWFAMSSADMEMTRSIYLAVLRKDIPSPLAKESDEEEVLEKEENSSEKEPEKKCEIHFDRLNFRILSLPIPEGNYFDLQVGEEGRLYYMEAPPMSGGPKAKGTKLHYFNLDERKDEVILSQVDSYKVSFNKKKVLYHSGKTWGIVPSGKKIKPGEGKMETEAVEVHIEPRKEWKQIFHEAWRINRDYFYAPNMHGVDWKDMRRKYSQFLPHLSCRSDLNRLIQWMCSELRVGHHRVGGGDTAGEPQKVPGGLLGADYSVENGRYRFKKVYGGLNWNPHLRSPLTEPGVAVKQGEYLLAVEGKEIRPPTNLFSRFENTAGKIVELRVGPHPDGSGSRTVQVVPVESESALRNRYWVEKNIEKVDEATDGRVAYVYVPNTTTLGHTYFKRYFFPQSHKEAIIIDERFNGGGQVADYYIDILRRPFICYWAMRYGADLKTPSASIQGPKVMLINETAGSGGDLLPWMFRKLNMGELIGKRTWGGLVGTLGFPVLMDGGYVTAPNLAIWTEKGWVVENEGVPPDIEVNQTPKEVIEGRDPQLEKAIQVVLKKLKENPPRKLERPPYPVKKK
ncbi:PD40 domain-containing protein [bacterium]|nr:PD40 domain-containing protein [bacterium]